MIHVRQTRATNCGQACVAMLTSNPIEMIEARMRVRGCTSAKQLAAYLLQHGITLGRTRRVRAGLLDWTGSLQLLLHVRQAPESGESSHWALWDGERVFDPTLDGPVGASWYYDEVGFCVTAVSEITRSR